MRLATLANGTPDGRLHLVSRDNRRWAPAEAAPTLQAALEAWDEVEPRLRSEYDALNADGGSPFDAAAAAAPLPRAWQWLDGSAFASHGELMQKAFNLPPVETGGRPLMYQASAIAFTRRRRT